MANRWFANWFVDWFARWFGGARGPAQQDQVGMPTVVVATYPSPLEPDTNAIPVASGIVRPSVVSSQVILPPRN